MKNIITLFGIILFSLFYKDADGQSVRANKDTSKVTRISNSLGIEAAKIKRLLISLRSNQSAIDSVLHSKTLNPGVKHEMFLKLKGDRENIINSTLTPAEREKFNQMAETIAADRNNGMRTQAETGIKLKPLKDSVKVRQRPANK